MRSKDNCEVTTLRKSMKLKSKHKIFKSFNKVVRSYDLSGNKIKKKNSISLTPSVDYIKEFFIIYRHGDDGSSKTPSEKIKLHKEKDFSLPLKVSENVNINIKHKNLVQNDDILL